MTTDILPGVLADLGRGDHRGVVVDSPPGAGKSTLVVRAATELAASGEPLIVVAQTNEQVDDLTVRLAEAAPDLPLAAQDYQPLARILRQPSVAVEAKVTDLPGWRVIVGTAAKWATVTDGNWPWAIVDEAYQMRSDMLLRIANRFERALFVGDPGQLDPFSTIDIDRWTGLTWDPMQSAVAVLLRHNPSMPVHRLPVSWRLPATAAPVVAEAFYPFTGFTSGTSLEQRQLAHTHLLIPVLRFQGARVKAQEITFEELVTGNKQFVVPLYQRTYSWSEKQWKPLWTAIREQAEGLLDRDQGPGHFLGSVVLSPGYTLPGGPQRWVVVDGQQRLTTLAILLSAVRDRVRDEDEKLATHIHEDFLVNRWEQGDDELKVLPTQADRAAFRACICGEPNAGAAGGIGEAYRFFQRTLEVYDDPDDPADLHRVFKVITRRLELVWIAADRDDNVHRIFESLNNTGLALSQADLLRNYLFMLLPTRGEQVYASLWQPMQDDLGSKDLELLAWLDLVMRGQAKVRRDDVYRQQQRRLRYLEGLRDEAAVEAEIAELARRARLLGLLQHPERENHPGVRAALERLAAWDAVTTYPIAITVLNRRDQNTVSDAEAVEALTCMESFLVRRMLCGTPTNNLNRILNSAPPEIAEGPVVEKIREYLSRERHYWASDDAIREAIRDRNFYWSGRAQQRQFVLRRLEESHDHKEPVDWSLASLTIEHVMPQTLNQAWRRELEPVVPAGQSVREIHAAFLHTLGNLTLSGYNVQLSNRPFTEKRGMLRDSGLAMNHAIARNATWGPEEITVRADDLAERALRLWPGPISRPAEPPMERPKWRLLRQVLTALPAGTWTTAGDLAEVISSYQGVVARQLRNNAFPHAWRILEEDGTVPSDFQWSDPAREDDPAQVLATEGVRIIDGIADEYQRMWAVELADAAGLETEEPGIPAHSDDSLLGSFWTALESGEAPGAADGLRALLDVWRSLGGDLRVVGDEELVGYLCWGGESPLAPWEINPENGYIEIAFRRIKTQAPFDDVSVREHFRKLCNAIDGVTVPAAKIDFRPWFPLRVFESPQSGEAARHALEWFAEMARA